MQITTFNFLIYCWIALAIILFPIQLKITAPYGRHSNPSWGWLMDNRLGWIIMEIISLFIFVGVLLISYRWLNVVTCFLFGIWILHYFNRSIIYPLKLKTQGKKIPVFIVLSAMFFNSINAGTNAYYLAFLQQGYPADYWYEPRFVVGLFLFLSGALLNLYADRQLLNLRKKNERGYQIPKGGFFKWISCPNHFGEMIEWVGFALMAWNLPAIAFAIWTIANLLPRALAHHRWYQKHFSNYPKDRKAVIPFLI